MAEPEAIARELLDRLEPRLPAIVELTGRLVGIDSGSGDAGGVTAVTEIVAARLEDLRFAVQLHPVNGAGSMLVARRAVGGRRVLVVGHADTVWPAGTVAEWPFRRVGDRLEGPGVGDMKASLAMACEVLGALAECGRLDEISVTVVVVPDEETGSRGSRAAIEQAAGDADICLGLEAADPAGAVVVGRSAVGAMVVRARGRSAHTTDEPPGVSALAPLAAAVAQLEGLSDRGRSELVTAGILRAGTARQVVPDAGELHLDLRAPDAASAERLEARVREVLQGAVTQGVSLEVDGGVLRPAWEPSRAGERLYAIAAAAGAAVGEPVAARIERGGSDASFPGALGVPTLDGLGPVCHHSCSRRETVEVSSIPRRGAIFGAVLASDPAGVS